MDMTHLKSGSAWDKYMYEVFYHWRPIADDESKTELERIEARIEMRKASIRYNKARIKELRKEIAELEKEKEELL
jgi:septal ring factor EnvC (AmiA/AmiB activator)